MHKIPSDIKHELESKKVLSAVWQDITVLARNEWICWIISAKQKETRDRRLRIMIENLQKGKRRPCCWGGCSHR